MCWENTLRLHRLVWRHDKTILSHEQHHWFKGSHEIILQRERISQSLARKRFGYNENTFQWPLAMGPWGMKLEVWVETGGSKNHSIWLSLSLSLSPYLHTHTYIYTHAYINTCIYVCNYNWGYLCKNQANMPNTLTSSAVFHVSGGYGVEPGGGSSSSSKPKVRRLPRKLGSFPRGFCMACHMIKRPRETNMFNAFLILCLI